MAEPITFDIRDLSPPGEILEEALKERGMAHAELARRTGLSEKHVSQLVNARVPLSMDVALLLERVLGVPAHVWNQLEFNYRTELKRKERAASLSQYAAWARQFPVRAMIECGYLEEMGRKIEDRIEALLDFFAVTSPDSWTEQWNYATARFRQSPSFKPSFPALTAWLRQGEIETQAIRCDRFDGARFSASLQEVRALTTEAPEVFVPKLVDLCAAAGVAVALVPALPRLAVGGVTRWVAPDKAAILLSLRHKSDDQLWFSFFHEAYHVLQHKTKTIHIHATKHPDDDPHEVRANRFARDILIPPADHDRLAASVPLRLSQIERFAAEIGVAPGIVVGRLQFEGVLPYTHGNGLKRRFRWEFED